MKHFFRIAQGVDVIPAGHALALNPDLWNANDLRTKHPETAHAEVDDIWMMFNVQPDDPKAVVDDIQTHPYPAWEKLAPIKPLVLDLMRRVGGTQLGRVIVTRLKPGAVILPHTDGGAPATFYRRYQIAIQSLPGALFHIEDETVNFQTGDVWWINNRANHSVVNNSTGDRVVVIVDIRIC